MPSTRRAFLTTCGLTVTAGCLGRGGRFTPYQLVAGVEWKTIRGTRDNTIEKIAQNDPIDGPVGDEAPRDLAVRTTAYDDTVVDLSERGPLTLSEATIGRLEEAYTDPYTVVVLTVYNEDPYNDIPNGNSFGYRATFDQFNRVNPGNRIATTIDRDRDVPALGDLLTVDRAERTHEVANPSRMISRENKVIVACIGLAVLTLYVIINRFRSSQQCCCR